jgi:hypothetical protein
MNDICQFCSKNVATSLPDEKTGCYGMSDIVKAPVKFITDTTIHDQPLVNKQVLIRL